MARLPSLLFVLWVGATVGTVVDLQKRILGGQDCLNNERQYHVQLRKSSPSDRFVCGGSLISAQWILTAAHCWDKTLVQIAGHAHTTVDQKNQRVTVQSNTLLCANTDVVNCQPLRDCVQKKYRQLWATRSCEHWLCFNRAGVEVSGGDSGGGVVYNGMIYGVHVLSEKRTCNLPAASMDVCRYIDWIVRTTGIARPRKVRLGCALL
ncbi:hypothetical protein VZT92_013885 [Zoarces viviparus]|uniref:Peptidase S1 domain-containing protein n=1 Tax=Zoarces viviparus TaxID=48416 RepID=A0AAW1EY77_ZOAVI